MLLKLVLLLSAICAISAEIVEIDCFESGTSCTVEGLPENLPVNATWKFTCPHDCTQFQMRNVSFPRFPRELWIAHQQVNYVYMTGTDFEELAFGDFFNAVKLTRFVLRDNKKFMALRDNCFWGAFELQGLDFYGNQINDVEGGAFNGIPLLETLELQDNNITYISNDLFRNLPNLRYLYLFFNEINTIETEAFHYNTELYYLNINSNNLTELDLLLTHNNHWIIYATENQLTKVSIRSITHGFEEFNDGAIIYLNQNALTQLYIQPNFNAETLILWENSIDRIDMLPALTSLKVLNLQRCDFRSLDGQRFGNKFVNMHTLYLTGNNIVSFNKDTFAGLDKLETLHLNVNEITDLDFPRLEALSFLELRYNNLTTFPYDADIRNTFPALKELDLRNNDFDDEYMSQLAKTFENLGILVEWES